MRFESVSRKEKNGLILFVRKNYEEGHVAHKIFGIADDPNIKASLAL